MAWTFQRARSGWQRIAHQASYLPGLRNLDGALQVTHALLLELRARKARSFNIGLIQSFVHVNRWQNSAAYTTSKHGSLGFTSALAAELGKDGVRVEPSTPG